QLDDVVPAGRGLDVGGRDVADPLDGDVVDAHPGVEGEGGEDGDLRGGVVAVDVRRRVGLRVAQGLRVGERLAEADAAGGHLVEDEVRRAVDDADDAAHVVPGEGLAHPAHDGDGAGDGGLEVEVDAALLGGLVELGAVGGEQGLVRGDDSRAGLDRLEDEAAGRLDAAHELDDEVRAADEAGRVGGEQPGVDDVGTGHGGVPDRDAHDLEPGPGPRGEVVGLLGQQPHHLGPDGPAPEHGDA